MSEPRAKYLRTVGLQALSKKSARKAALDRAHAIRQFEIDLYWKRANYFWLLQAAVFAAVGFTWRMQAETNLGIVPVGLAALGLVTSFAGWLAAHGSKFWQRNWEHHIDMLEGEFEGRLYKTVYVSRAGMRWSLTGVSESLALCFSCFWVFSLLVVSLSANPNWTLNPDQLTLRLNPMELQTVACWALAALGLRFLYAQASELTGDIERYSGTVESHLAKTDKPRLRRDPAATPFLISREPNIK